MDNELKRNTLGLSGLIFQGMGQLSPLFTFDGIISVAAFALGASPLAFLIGMVASLLTGNTLYQFSKRTASARGYYGYASMSLGHGTGFFTSYIYILYQIANLMFVFSFFIMIFNPALEYITGINIPFYFSVIIISLLIMPSFYMVYRGLRPSFRSQIILNSIEIAFVVIISVEIIITSHDNSIIPFTPVSGYKSLFLGFITGSFLAYTGYGSIVPLGEEAREPKRNIGIAILAMILIIGVLDLLISYALVVGFGINSMDNFSNLLIPSFMVIQSHAGRVVDLIFFILNIIIIYTLFNTIATSLTRNIYAMARDGFLPERFLKLNSHSVPHNALYLTAIIFTVSALISGAVFYLYFSYSGFLDEFIMYATVSSLSTLIIHLITNTGLSRVRKSMLTDAVLPSISSIIILVAFYYTFSDFGFPFLYSEIILLIYSILIITIYFTKLYGKHLKIAENNIKI